MKKHLKTQASGRSDLDEILPEYDFSRASPNKYATRYRPGRTEPESETNLASKRRRQPRHNGNTRKSTSISHNK